jgi:thioredoxin 1
MADHVSEVTDADFEARVLGADKPVLVDFWATWCAPCRMIAPAVEEIASELGDAVEVVKLDVDQNPQTVQQLGIMSMPTIMMFKDGKAADRHVGYRPGIKQELKQKLEALIAS